MAKTKNKKLLTKADVKKWREEAAGLSRAIKETPGLIIDAHYIGKLLDKGRMIIIQLERPNRDYS